MNSPDEQNIRLDRLESDKFSIASLGVISLYFIISHIASLSFSLLTLVFLVAVWGCAKIAVKIDAEIAEIKGKK